jgi:hypothetical protein
VLGEQRFEARGDAHERRGLLFQQLALGAVEALLDAAQPGHGSRLRM